MRRLRRISKEVQSTGASPTARSRTAGPGPPPTRRLPGRPTVQGVGSGAQTCSFDVTVPIAVPQKDGTTKKHLLNAPIVEGAGSELPGLPGLKSLETSRAVLDTGRRMLIFPGPGPIEYQLPPGSIEIPLEKAPFGPFWL